MCHHFPSLIVEMISHCYKTWWLTITMVDRHYWSMVNNNQESADDHHCWLIKDFACFIVISSVKVSSKHFEPNNWKRDWRGARPCLFWSCTKGKKNLQHDLLSTNRVSSALPAFSSFSSPCESQDNETHVMHKSTQSLPPRSDTNTMVWLPGKINNSVKKCRELLHWVD